MPFLHSKVLAVALAAAAPAAGAFDAVAGYTPVSNISSALAVGQALEDVSAALGLATRDWDAAKEAYSRELDGGLTLQGILPADYDKAGRKLLQEAVAYYGSSNYVHEFSYAALQGTGTFSFSGADRPQKMREELAMKGIVLQGVLMAAITYLEDSIKTCQGAPANDDGAPHEIDMAWGLYACSESAGPIKLAEKRAPQYGVLATPGGAAGNSQVNVKLLQLFKELQAAARAGNCIQLVNKVPQAIATMQIPVIQGMLREAYEVDPKESGQHGGADGFVEVAEGWAFTRAVLPSIDACSSDAAAVIVRNMGTLELGPDGPHVPDGYEIVKQAVESQYECLGIACAEVNAMVNIQTDQVLWQPCSDSALPPVPSTNSPTPAPTAPVDEVASGGLRGASTGSLWFLVLLTAAAATCSA